MALLFRVSQGLNGIWRFFSRALGNRCCEEQVCQVALSMTYTTGTWHHDDVIKWKHFPRYWPFVRGIHWSPVNSPHKGQWRGALMFSLICTWINGDLRRHRAHYDVTVMIFNIEDTRRIWSRWPVFCSWSVWCSRFIQIETVIYQIYR